MNGPKQRMNPRKGRINARFEYRLESVSVVFLRGVKQSLRNFYVAQEGHYVLIVFLNHSETEKYPETHIQWSENNTDIIKAEFIRTNNAVIKKLFGLMESRLLIMSLI